MGPRTNNATEGWHNAIRTFFGARHPQIFKFIDGIKLEQGLQETKMNQLQAGHAPKTGQKKYKDITAKLKNVVKTYNDPEVFQFKLYLDGIANSIHI